MKKDVWLVETIVRSAKICSAMIFSGEFSSINDHYYLFVLYNKFILIFIGSINVGIMMSSNSHASRGKTIHQNQAISDEKFPYRKSKIKTWENINKMYN